MQVNENAGQVPQVKRVPDVVEGTPSVKNTMPKTLDDGAGVDAPRPVATRKPDAAVEPKRQQFGAGF